MQKCIENNDFQLDNPNSSNVDVSDSSNKGGDFSESLSDDDSAGDHDQVTYSDSLQNVDIRDFHNIPGGLTTPLPATANATLKPSLEHVGESDLTDPASSS